MSASDVIEGILMVVIGVPATIIALLCASGAALSAVDHIRRMWRDNEDGGRFAVVWYATIASLTFLWGIAKWIALP